MTVQTITPQQLQALRQAGEIDLIDVRTPVEFREVHVEFARNFPLDALNPQAVQTARGSRQTEPLYVICNSGGRGQKACDQFIAAGITQVVNVEGGTRACDQAGLAVVRGKKAMSLERQVRIAAGLLVIIGEALGAFVDQRWIGLSAFVGAGLVFAGVTDTCGMAMFLGKMPWNQVSGATCQRRP